MFKKININADLGELGASLKVDQAIMPYLSMCNIATGGHAGDSVSMEGCIKLALENKVMIGAHPSFPDKENFGRKRMDISDKDLLKSLTNQMNEFIALCEINNARIHHIKAHGALYHYCCDSDEGSDVLLRLYNQLGLKCKLLGKPNCLLSLKCKAHQLPYLREGFGDRAYDNKGNLVSRSKKGAVHSRIDQIINQVLGLHQHNEVESIDGKKVPLTIDTICMHSDGKQAVSNIKALSKHLKQKWINVAKAV